MPPRHNGTFFQTFPPLCVGSTDAVNHDILFHFICKLLSLHGLIILGLLESAPPASRTTMGKKERESVLNLDT